MYKNPTNKQENKQNYKGCSLSEIVYKKNKLLHYIFCGN